MALSLFSYKNRVKFQVVSKYSIITLTIFFVSSNNLSTTSLVLAGFQNICGCSLHKKMLILKSQKIIYFVKIKLEISVK